MIDEDLMKRLNGGGSSFFEYLRKIINQKGMTEVEVYKKVNLDRRIFSRIRRDKNYFPSKRILLTIAFSLELSLDEVEDFLKSGGYALSEFIKEDLIVKFSLRIKFIICLP